VNLHTTKLGKTRKYKKLESCTVIFMKHYLVRTFKNVCYLVEME
jgi:hypothetical protein